MSAGYSNIDRNNGFDLEGAKLLLRDLAQFHALPIALRIKSPEVFDKKVKKNCEIFPHVFPTDYQGAAIEAQTPKPPEWLDPIGRDEKSKPYLQGVRKALLERNPLASRLAGPPFISIAHNDMWVNNTMQIVKAGKLSKNKFIDFQLYEYGSAICDLIFFIFGSCQIDVSRDHFDYLLKYYHSAFVETLVKHGCDSTPFVYRKFLERVNIEAPTELIHSLYLAVPIHGKKGVANVDVTKDDFEVEGAVTQEAIQKIVYMVYEYGRRGWIKN